MIKKVLIANRGEIAIRIIRTCKSMGIKTIAVYSKCDKDSYHVFLADEAICIGGNDIKDSYLNINNIISAAINTKADAIHPGYGFLSENYEFAKRVEENGLVFIGPTSDILKIMSDKSDVKIKVKNMGVPVIDGQSYEDFSIKPNLDFPIMIKSKFGGGGKGIRVINDKDEFASKEKTIKEELRNSFNESDLYIEKYINVYKHIEIQLIADKYGNISALPERDCSCQRKYQKFIEESPSIIKDKELINRIKESAILIFKKLNYNNIGTVEFLLDKENNYYFLEINARIQVEHAVTEMVTDIDLVKEQIRMADGLENKYKNIIKAKKYAIECRINAEDPENNFLPSIGEVNIFNIPSGSNIRVDTYIYQGYNLKPYYDSLIYKIIVYGDNRKDTVKKLYNYLDEFIVFGIKTNINYLQNIIDSKDFLNGSYSIFN